MHAYAETYLPRAMKNLGEAFDYALTACRIPVLQLQSRFAASREAAEWEEGSPRVLAGLSGTELIQHIFSERSSFPAPQCATELSREYWTGWALAYYHWWSARRFTDIFACVPLDEMLESYASLHEASENRFVDHIEARITERAGNPPLRRLRENRGLTQMELARRSGVNVRNIRHYEQDAPSIAKAESATLSALARTLGCNLSDLLIPQIEITD